MADQQLTIRRLHEADADLVAAFTCVVYPHGWQTELPELVAVVVTHLQTEGNLRAAGGFIGNALVGLAAWEADGEDPRTWLVPLVAVQLGYQRRGVGRMMKEHVVEEARRSGAEFIVSTVHASNDAMLSINATLGAEMIRLPPTSWDPGFFRCIVSLA